jgi:hypothetical protein
MNGAKGACLVGEWGGDKEGERYLYEKEQGEENNLMGQEEENN